MTKTERNTKKLLNENKKALRALHKIMGYDFEADYTCLCLTDKFTVNTINKLTNGNDAVILIKNSISKFLHGVFYNSKTKKFEFEQFKNTYFYYNIDYYFSKKDFEETRKKCIHHYYIIFQNSDLLKPIEQKQIDYTERFKFTTTAKCYNPKTNEHYITGVKLFIPDNMKAIDYRLTDGGYIPLFLTKSDNVNDIIDKSGFLVHRKREELKAKAYRLKEQRNKEKAQKVNFDSELNLIKKNIEDCKKYIMFLTLEAKTEKDIEKIEKLFKQLSEAFHRLEYYHKHINDYSNIEAKHNDIINIELKTQVILMYKNIKAGNREKAILEQRYCINYKAEDWNDEHKIICVETFDSYITKENRKSFLYDCITNKIVG